MKEIQLTQGKVALVDDEDYERLSKWSWCFSTGYAARGTKVDGKFKMILMHREIMGVAGEAHSFDREVDHIDGNRLNNCRSNLRLVSRQQNVWNAASSRNKSGRRGVVQVQRRNKTYFRAIVSVGGKQRTVGYFHTLEAAAEARDAFIREHHGEYGILSNGERLGTAS